MNSLSINQMEIIQGGDFWGQGNCSAIDGTQTIVEHNGGAWDCTMLFTCTRYAFWIPIGTVVGNGNCQW